MCGACGSPRTSGADAILGTAYGRVAVARLLAAAAPGVVVTAHSSGWAVGGAGGAVRTCRTSAELFAALAARAGTGHRAWAQGILSAAPHRPLTTDRATFPASSVAPARAGATAAPADRVIHHVLVTALGREMHHGHVPAGVVLADEAGAWTLRLSGAAGGRADQPRPE